MIKQEDLVVRAIDWKYIPVELKSKSKRLTRPWAFVRNKWEY